MTGEDLIKAIVNNDVLKWLNDCFSVPVQMGCAVYGKPQNDNGGKVIEKNKSMDNAIKEAIVFLGANSETAVWHFAVMKPKVHHFVVIPWYKQSAPNQGIVYTVFMAYENEYMMVNYVKHNSPAPGSNKGYKDVWTANDLKTMLSDLLVKGNAWEEYFGNVGASQAQEIKYYKYKEIALNSAVASVQRFRERCS